MELAAASRLWFLHVENVNANSIPGKETEFDNVLVTSIVGETENGSSHVYTLKGDELQKFSTGDFEPEAGASVELFTLLGGTRIVQVLPTEIRAFDGGESPTRLSLFHRQRFQAWLALVGVSLGTAAVQCEGSFTRSVQRRGHNSEAARSPVVYINLIHVFKYRSTSLSLCRAMRVVVFD